jgi:hypothetical protein
VVAARDHLNLLFNAPRLEAPLVAWAHNHLYRTRFCVRRSSFHRMRASRGNCRYRSVGHRRVGHGRETGNMREPGKIERDGEKPAALSVKGAGEVRAGDQPKDRQGARPRSAADTAGLRRRSAVPLGLMVARTFSIRRVGSPIGDRRRQDRDACWPQCGLPAYAFAMQCRCCRGGPIEAAASR